MRVSVGRVSAAVVALLAILLAGSLVVDGSSPKRRGTTVVPADGKPIVTSSSDSLAPENAPAHWLPPEAWVYNHWLPFDETRLYALLDLTRVELWEHLRDDRRSVAQLAARRGWSDTRRLAAALVEPHRARVGPERAGRLEERARRVLTQGHLAQHLFFHSLHQFAIPSAAPEIFGVTDARFRALRRAEVSPLTIARLNGRSVGHVEAVAIAVLRERMAAGIRSGAMPEAQGRRLLYRQLTQLPRWLDQARYNGPPPTTRGALLTLPRDYASNPAISGDGRHVVYEAYRQKLPLAVKLGEIAVMRADLHDGRSRVVGGLGDGRPVSNYNPGVSADGRRITYETSAGNQNFAKRYGRISVLLTDLRRRRTHPVSRPHRDGADIPSDYNPVLAADGRREAFQGVRGGRTAIVVRDLPSGRERIAVHGTAVGATRFADVFEPGLSADGRKLVYTGTSGRVGDPSSARSEVRVRDLQKGTTTVVSRGKVAEDPAISPDGRWVAFTTRARDAGGKAPRPRLLLHDLATRRTIEVPATGATALDPVVARRGRTVAYTSLHGSRSSVRAWSRSTGTTALVSRASGSGGATADGLANDPSISADGRYVAFASTARNLAAGNRDGARAVFVRDMRRGRTRLISEPAAAYPRTALAAVLAKAKAADPAAPAPVTAPTRPELRPGEIAVTDNAFVSGTDRPTVRVGVGEPVTWSWLSRQSHALRVRSGPERFVTKARNTNRLTRRFGRPGTYHLVCALHAPGMRMTVVVD